MGCKVEHLGTVCNLQDVSGWGRNPKWEREGIKTFLGGTSMENIRNKGQKRVVGYINCQSLCLSCPALPLATVCPSFLIKNHFCLFSCVSMCWSQWQQLE